MPVSLLTALMPIISSLIDMYIKSTSSKKDDEVLEIVKKGAKYLACKDNNTVSKKNFEQLQNKRVLND